MAKCLCYDLISLNTGDHYEIPKDGRLRGGFLVLDHIGNLNQTILAGHAMMLSQNEIIDFLVDLNSDWVLDSVARKHKDLTVGMLQDSFIKILSYLPSLPTLDSLHQMAHFLGNLHTSTGMTGEEAGSYFLYLLRSEDG